MSAAADRPEVMEPSDALEAAASRLREALTLLQVIDHDMLFAELPANRLAALRHQHGVSLLAVLLRELEGLAADLEAAIAVQALVDRIRGNGRAGDPREAASKG